MTGTRTVRVDGPAKINLGLELLGKRADGYHEIRSVMAMVGLYDRLTVSARIDLDADVVEGLDLGAEQNLIAAGIDAYRTAGHVYGSVKANVTKHIPIAAGLGGASADAAASLLALDLLNDDEAQLGRQRLIELAAGLGSDVPFFLGSPIALTSGTGTTLTPLPALPTSTYAVLVSPAIDLHRKTATLYGAVDPSDFTDGSRSGALAEAIRAGSLPEFGPELLANPFRAAWRRLGDPIASVEELARRGGAPWVALSGAGPTVYTLTDDPERATAIAMGIRGIARGPVQVNIAPILADGMNAVPECEP